MLLAIDLRNKGVVVGFRDEGRWRSMSRLGTERTADEFGFLLASSAARAQGSGRSSPVDSAWVSSVVPAATPKILEAVRLTFGIEPALVGPGTKSGIKIRTDNPAELGSDIVCSAVAARARNGGASVIVDFGAAIVLSAVNSSSELLGVSIAPGLGTAAASLRTFAAQLPEVNLAEPGRAIGKNTTQSIQSGILLGYGGLVTRLVGLMADEMGEPAAVLGTGHEAGRALMASVGYDTFVPELALDGLAILAERNTRRDPSGRIC